MSKLTGFAMSSDEAPYERPFGNRLPASRKLTLALGSRLIPSLTVS